MGFISKNYYFKDNYGNKINVNQEEWNSLIQKKKDGYDIVIQDNKPISIVHEKTIDEYRVQREKECFSIINRGKLWYDNLTTNQLQELQNWYYNWLDVTETKRIPNKPDWLN